MNAEQRGHPSNFAHSRGTNTMINRACEIFVDARQAIGDDLSGFSLVDLLADNSGWSLVICRELATIVVERCECSDRLRELYSEDY